MKNLEKNEIILLMNAVKYTIKALKQDDNSTDVEKYINDYKVVYDKLVDALIATL